MKTFVTNANSATETASESTALAQQAPPCNPRLGLGLASRSS